MRAEELRRQRQSPSLITVLGPPKIRSSCNWNRRGEPVSMLVGPSSAVVGLTASANPYGGRSACHCNMP